MTARRAVLEVHPLLGTVETHHGCIVLELHLLVFGEVGQAFHLIGIAKGEKSQALAGLTLLTWMDAVFKARIHQNRHASIGNHGLCQLLLFSQILASAPLDK